MFVPNDQAMLTDIFEPFRYIVVRERLGDQLRLLDVEAIPKQTNKLNGLPFPTMVLENVAYKIGAIVTDRRSEDAAKLIGWHYERCGKSEESLLNYEKETLQAANFLRQSSEPTRHGGH